jgi:anaerobic magnesium-protoporphyrin IX monomethyl ester cyclase
MLFLKANDKQIRDNYKKRLKTSFKHEVDYVTDNELDIFERYIINYKPDILAFSLVCSVFGLYKKIYEKIRKLGSFKIVLGGWEPSLNPEQCINYCDIVCIGEGENVLPELVDKMYNGQEIDDIANLWIRKDNRIIRNNTRPLMDNLNDCPNPIFDNNLSAYIENDEIVYEDPYMSNTRYGIITGRGCPYHCTYCSNNYMAKNIYPKKWSKTRQRSVDHVMDELISVKERLPKIERINFYDEVFLPNKVWLNEFTDRYKAEIDLPFYCMFYPGTCNDETAKLLKEAGLVGVWIGVQSGSERVRTGIFKRNYTNRTVLKQAETFHKYGVSVRYDFILDNPFETFDESLESINLMLEFPQPFSLNLFSLKYFPKTEITSMALAEGLISENDLADQRLEDQDNYHISMNQKNINNKFINYLGTYISFKAVELKVDKNEIEKIINDYLVNRDISPLENKVVPFLSE